METITQLKKILGDQLGLAPDSIRDSAKIQTDLHADSLDQIEIIIEVEHVFDIKLEEPEYQDLATVAELANLIQTKLQK